MKIINLICVIGICLLFVFGCAKSIGLPKPEGLFPDSVGKYKLKNVDGGSQLSYHNEKNPRQEFSSWHSVYADDDKKRIIYRAGIHKTSDEGTNEVKFLTDCYDTNRKLQIDRKIWENIPLKDKSNKNVGIMAVCFIDKPLPAYEEGKTLGDYNYIFSFSNDNRTYTVKSDSVEQGELAEFIKALPFNSQLDLSVLDQFSSQNTTAPIKYDETFKDLPPVKFAANPYLKGNILVLEQKPTDDNEKANYISNLTDYYVADSNRQAMLPGNIGSMVLIDCKKGNRMGDYSLNETTKVPAFGSVCELSVIDNKIPAIIAKKTFSNNSLPDTTVMETDKKGKVANNQYIAPYPRDEIKKFFETLLNK